MGSHSAHAARANYAMPHCLLRFYLLLTTALRTKQWLLGCIVGLVGGGLPSGLLAQQPAKPMPFKLLRDTLYINNTEQPDQVNLPGTPFWLTLPPDYVFDEVSNIFITPPPQRFITFTVGDLSNMRGHTNWDSLSRYQLYPMLDSVVRAKNGHLDSARPVVCNGLLGRLMYSSTYSLDQTLMLQILTLMGDHQIFHISSFFEAGDTLQPATSQAILQSATYLPQRLAPVPVENIGLDTVAHKLGSRSVISGIQISRVYTLKAGQQPKQQYNCVVLATGPLGGETNPLLFREMAEELHDSFVKKLMASKSHEAIGKPQSMTLAGRPSWKLSGKGLAKSTNHEAYLSTYAVYDLQNDRLVVLSVKADNSKTLKQLENAAQSLWIKD